MKIVESEDEILVAVIDETYGHTDDDEYETLSREFHAKLESEFGMNFEESNIGPGADIPAFETFIRENLVPMLPWLMAIFFSGKPIRENVAAWRDIGQAIRQFFSRQVVLSRNGAAVIAVESVFEDMGGLPKSVRLISYRNIGIWDIDKAFNLPETSEVEESCRTINLGMAAHVFEIEADGIKYRVLIEGKRSKTKRL